MHLVTVVVCDISRLSTGKVKRSCYVMCMLNMYEKCVNMFRILLPHAARGGVCFWLAATDSFYAQSEGASTSRCDWTRWSPRTRMLTRIFMVQMSKHMVRQARTIPFCNRLFEQSRKSFASYQSAVWSGKCRVWSAECELRCVECKVWSWEFRVCKV